MTSLYSVILYFCRYFDASETLTIKNNKGAAALLSFDFSVSGNFAVGSLVTVNGTEYTAAGSHSINNLELANGGIVTIKLSADRCNASNGANTVNISITNISLVLDTRVTATFVAPDYGSYTVSYGDITETISAGTAAKEIVNQSSVQYTLTAIPGNGYKFVGWYNVTDGKYINFDTVYKDGFDTEIELKPIIVSDVPAVFGVGDERFTDLTEACNYASGTSSKTVFVAIDGTVSGDHTIPVGITLLIPFNSSNTLYKNSPKCISDNGEGTLGSDVNKGWSKPYAYRTLTLSEDANITVEGAIEVGGEHAAANGGSAYCGAPTGPVGFINMISGSEITLESGSNLYAWGYIIGAGNVTAKNGSTVYELFQLTDFRGGTNTDELTGAGLVFPINQYYVQNIEVPTSYEYGAVEMLASTIFSGTASIAQGGQVQFMGSNGMFKPAQGSTVTKDYDETRDRMVVSVNGNSNLGSLSVDMSAIKVDSSEYVLPMTNNMTINIISGNTVLDQSIALLPGTELNVNYGATLTIGSRTAGKINSNNSYNNDGQDLIIYDYDEWTYGYALSVTEYTEANRTTGYFAFCNAANKRPLGSEILRLIKYHFNYNHHLGLEFAILY